MMELAPKLEISALKDFPWNLPEEWAPELPVNRQLLGERYKSLVADLKDKSLEEIRLAVKADPSALSIFERGVLYQELLRFFGGSGWSACGIPLEPNPGASGSELASPVSGPCSES
ncbi:MAG: hypothetical protein K2W95_26555 [Candidatus Obscuribacterales bacterium]|nr:hypothetical protein [Candidatus Obscuribacterales bacterium]